MYAYIYAIYVNCFSDLRPFSALNWDAVSHTTTRPKSKTSVRAFSGKSRDTLDEVQTRFLSKVSITDYFSSHIYEHFIKHSFLLGNLQIKKSHSLVEKALQAFDVTDSGFVSQENLRSVLSNFLFPMDDNIFRELLNRYEILKYCLCTYLIAVVKFI